ncbi:pilin [Plesiomonas shigelloides]|uniref:pilin n=1 Tax=Plesiomonas shigelloides TaxID=703 RepID=UPI00387F364A
MKAVNKGFTLIELMIVVAIVAILAAIALPAYQSYTEKAKMTELMQASSPIKSALEIYAFEKGADGFTGAAVGENGLPTAASVGEGPNIADEDESYTVTVTDADNVTLSVVGAKDLAEHVFILQGKRFPGGTITWYKKCAVTDASTKTPLCVADTIPE